MCRADEENPEIKAVDKKFRPPLPCASLLSVKRAVVGWAVGWLADEIAPRRLTSQVARFCPQIDRSAESGTKKWVNELRRILRTTKECAQYPAILVTVLSCHLWVKK